MLLGTMTFLGRVIDVTISIRLVLSLLKLPLIDHDSGVFSHSFFSCILNSFWIKS